MTSPNIDPNLVGVSVIHIKGTPTLRFALRPHHLKQIGGPKKVDIRGSTREGLLIAPGKGYTPYKVGANLFYVQFALSVFESRLSEKPRATVWVRPNVSNGHIQLPSMPDAWVNADDEFSRSNPNGTGPHIFEPGPVTAKLSPFVGDPAATVKAEAVAKSPPVQANGTTNGAHHSATVPLPKAPVPNYHVPESLREMEAVLSMKIDEVRSIIRAMEEKTGLQFALDRALRVVVNLRPRDK
jgi:hypothetical protein